MAAVPLAHEVIPFGLLVWLKEVRCVAPSDELADEATEVVLVPARAVELSCVSSSWRRKWLLRRSARAETADSSEAELEPEHA